jgi:hypothetical protein
VRTCRPSNGPAEERVGASVDTKGAELFRNLLDPQGVIKNALNASRPRLTQRVGLEDYDGDIVLPSTDISVIALDAHAEWQNILINLSPLDGVEPSSLTFTWLTPYHWTTGAGVLPFPSSGYHMSFIMIQ